MLKILNNSLKVTELMKPVDDKLLFLIEDSVDIQVLIQRLYESEGYRVECALDGKQALEKLHSLQKLPFLILLDLMMPGMDGTQFRIKQEQDPALNQIPVVIMTADSNGHVKAKQLRAHGYLNKPVSVESLLELASKYSQALAART